MLSWQDSETRPGEFVIFMLSIITEKEDFEVNCLYKTRWDSLSRHRLGEKKSFLLKKLTQLFTHLFFLLNIQKQHTESIIYMSSFRMWKKRGIFSIETNYGAFNRGTLIRFLWNILHLRKKNFNFFTIFTIFFIFEI